MPAWDVVAALAIALAAAAAIAAVATKRRRQSHQAQRPTHPKGRAYPTAAEGLWVRSHGERRIANALARRHIPFEYEPRVLTYRPDFRITNTTILIEYWGGAAHRRYEAHMLDKIAAYEAAGWTVISLFPAHLHELERVLMQQLHKAGFTSPNE